MQCLAFLHESFVMTIVDVEHKRTYRQVIFKMIIRERIAELKYLAVRLFGCSVVEYKELGSWKQQLR